MFSDLRYPPKAIINQKTPLLFTLSLSKMKGVIPEFHVRILFLLQFFGIEADCHCHEHEEVPLDVLILQKKSSVDEYRKGNRQRLKLAWVKRYSLAPATR